MMLGETYAPSLHYRHVYMVHLLRPVSGLWIRARQRVCVAHDGDSPASRGSLPLKSPSSQQPNLRSVRHSNTPKRDFCTS